MAAIRTPRAIIGMDLRGGMSRAQAAKHPVQAPVKGRGVATKGTKNQRPYLENHLPPDLFS